MLILFPCFLSSSFPAFFLIFCNYVYLGRNYEQKIPDIEKSLALVHNLQKKKEAGESTMTRYNLADNVYGKAEVDCTVGIVNLWLGANVMLEYSYDEAIDFLTQNLESAREEFKVVKEDLAFVRDQIVTSEVAMTRIFNWDVRKRRSEGGSAIV
jgi:prefoldin subunit 5